MDERRRPAELIVEMAAENANPQIKEGDRNPAESLAITEQPPPIPNALPSCHDMAIADLRRIHPDSPAIAALLERKAIGLLHYGTPLQPNNGRDYWRDAKEELADFAPYLKGLLYELKEQGLDNPVLEEIYQEQLVVLHRFCKEATNG